MLGLSCAAALSCVIFSCSCSQDKTGLSAVALAAAGGHVECVAQILDSTTTATERGLSALHLAVQVRRAFMHNHSYCCPLATTAC